MLAQRRIVGMMSLKEVKGVEVECTVGELGLDRATREFLIQSWICPSILLKVCFDND